MINNDTTQRKRKLRDPTKYGVRFEYNELFSKLLAIQIERDKNHKEGPLHILNKLKEEQENSEKAVSRYFKRSQTPLFYKRISNPLMVETHTPDLNISLPQAHTLGRSPKSPTAPKLHKFYDLSAKSVNKRKFNLRESEEGMLKLIGKPKTLSKEKIKFNL
ncbi:unnamed protein product [Blepharisma stoltei]|uniref:Uncharacterized protein n=1 Tax=Blepharisma stoltei TaxID=1481888 RepID=A0AAU9K914_9CILI|nr:unnamed protein product [Blepharisma stoltei]